MVLCFENSFETDPYPKKSISNQPINENNKSKKLVAGCKTKAQKKLALLLTPFFRVDRTFARLFRRGLQKIIWWLF
mgnify:CR=1 FL=1